MHSVLIDLGAASLEAFWLPVLAWTVLALVAEAALRAIRPSARFGLATRGSLVALLPLGIVGPPLLARWVPSIRSAEPLMTRPLASAPPEAVPDALASLPPISPEALAPEALASIPALDWTALALGGATAAALILGVLALIALAGGLVWIARYRHRLSAATRPVRDEAEGLSRQMGVRRHIQVAVVDDAISPFTVGLWRPLVALPEDLTPEARRLALAHELAHVRDAHFGWAVCERLVRAAFVWHPLVHVLGRALALDREREADAAVLRLWPDCAAEYGQLLHALSTRPSPRFSLGASSSPLLSRLHAMTRSTPERRRLARLTGAMLLVLPLLASAAVLPDAPQQAFFSQPEAPAMPASPNAAPLAPEALPPPPPMEVPETPAAPEAPAVSADTLEQFMAQLDVRDDDGEMRVRLHLKNNASYEIGEAIADYYSDGDQEGELLITGNGFQIRRSTLRADALPPPPPPPPPPSAPEAPQPPPPPPTPSDADLARYSEVLSADLTEAQRAMEALSEQQKAERSEQYTRLKIRLDAVRQEQQRLIQEQERRRLNAMKREALGGDYH